MEKPVDYSCESELKNSPARVGFSPANRKLQITHGRRLPGVGLTKTIDYGAGRNQINRHATRYPLSLSICRVSVC